MLAPTTAIAAILAGLWLSASSSSFLPLALAPLAALIGLLVLISQRQAAAYLMLLSLPFAEISVGNGSSLVRYVLIAALAVWFVGASVFDSLEWLRLDRTDIKVLLWIGGSVVSAAFLNSSAVPGLALTYLNLALVYYLASRSIRNTKEARGVVLALSIGLGLVALLSLIFPNLAGSAVEGGVLRQGPLGASGAGGIDRFGGWLAVGVVLPWLALDRPWRASTIAARAASMVSLVALIATVSKAAMIALAVGLLCWIILSPPGARLPRMLTSLGGIAATWYLLPAGVHARFGQFLHPDSHAYSRMAIWDAGMKMFLSHPVTGVGVGNFAVYAPAYFPQGTPFTEAVAAHNVIIGALGETGLVGFLLLAMMIGAVLLEGYRLIRSDHRSQRECQAANGPDFAASRQRARLTLGLVVAYVVFLAVSLSADLERDRYFVVLAGLLHGLYRSRIHVRE